MFSQLNTMVTKGLAAAMLLALPFTPAIAGTNWGFSLGGGGLGFAIGDNDHHGRHGGYRGYRGYGGYGGYSGYGGNYYGNGGYYNNYYQSTPYYGQGNYYSNAVPYNPVVRREVITEGEYAPGGTFHSNTVVEDTRASATSPGRNTAITPPRTTTTRVYGPDGTWVNREQTSWIGADGRPHSTTINQETSQDVWGNTHTDTNVTLKNKQGNTTTETQTGDPVNTENSPGRSPGKQ